MPISCCIGNKCDLEQSLEVTEEAANDLARSLAISNSLQTSAKDGHNIHQAFIQLTKVSRLKCMSLI